MYQILQICAVKSRASLSLLLTLSKNMGLTKLTLYQHWDSNSPKENSPSGLTLLCASWHAQLFFFLSLSLTRPRLCWLSKKNDSCHREPGQKVVDHHPIILNGHCKPSTKGSDPSPVSVRRQKGDDSFPKTPINDKFITEAYSRRRSH